MLIGARKGSLLLAFLLLVLPSASSGQNYAGMYPRSELRQKATLYQPSLERTYEYIKTFLTPQERAAVDGVRIQVPVTGFRPSQDSSLDYLYLSEQDT